MKQIFAFNEWTVFEQEEDQDAYWNLDYDVVTHSCGWFHRRAIIHAWEMINTVACKRCGVTIPDEIVGIWKLHNFNRIQRDEGAESFYRSAFGDAPKYL